jgi:hypothetical protein
MAAVVEMVETVGTEGKARMRIVATVAGVPTVGVVVVAARQVMAEEAATSR